MTKKIGVLTSGGDAPGMNACIRAVVRAGLQKGFEVYAINGGYKGIMTDEITKVSRHFVSDIINRGGTILGTARLPEFKDPEVQKQAADKLKALGIDALVCIGGDGTYMGAQALSKLGINCIAIPATVDNDISSSDYTIGFDTCLNTIVDCVDRLRDTSSSHQRCSLIEVMGNRCGDLAAYAGLACGSEVTITNDLPMTKDEVIATLKAQREAGKEHAIVIVSEKLCDIHQFAREIQDKCGFDTRAEVLGHMQRGGKPTAFDRILASRLGVYAIELLTRGITSSCVGLVGNNLTYFRIEDALKFPRKRSEEYVNIGALIE